MIIAFGHQSNVGKNTAGGFLKDIIDKNTNSTTKVASFATPLKMTAYDLYGHLGVKHPDYYEENRADRDIVIPKLNMTVVELWIKIGRKMREIWSGTWLHKTLSMSDKHDFLIITDLRFPDEFEGVEKLGGYCLKITSPKVKVKGLDREFEEDHEWHGVIDNSGTKEDLYKNLEKFCMRENII